jgi:hypothetical protein
VQMPLDKISICTIAFAPSVQVNGVPASLALILLFQLLPGTALCISIQPYLQPTLLLFVYSLRVEALSTCWYK